MFGYVTLYIYYSLIHPLELEWTIYILYIYIYTYNDGRNFLVKEDLVCGCCLDSAFGHVLTSVGIASALHGQNPAHPSGATRTFKSDRATGVTGSVQGCTECTDGVEMQILIIAYHCLISTYIISTAGLEHVVCSPFVLSSWAQNDHGIMVTICHNGWTMHGCLFLPRRVKVRKATCSRHNGHFQLTICFAQERINDT